MKRKIVNIDQDKCNGCGLCVNACHEQAIVINEQGKAELIKEDYCDGLGDCLPACPMNAITIEEREAAPYDEKAVKARIAAKAAAESEGTSDCCSTKAAELKEAKTKSRLSHWPVQIRLAPPKADYFDGADILIAADCSAYAFADFHETFMKDRVTLMGCPKLDPVDYSEKLTEIFANNDVKSVTLVRMMVPCCGGMEMAVNNAISASGKLIPSQTIVLSLEGEILERK